MLTVEVDEFASKLQFSHSLVEISLVNNSEDYCSQNNNSDFVNSKEFINKSVTIIMCYHNMTSKFSYFNVMSKLMDIFF